MAGNGAYQLPFVAYQFALNAGDYVEFVFLSANAEVQLTALGAGANYPAAPSVIIVAKQIGILISGFSGSSG